MSFKKISNTARQVNDVLETSRCSRETSCIISDVRISSVRRKCIVEKCDPAITALYDTSATDVYTTRTEVVRGTNDANCWELAPIYPRSFYLKLSAVTSSRMVFVVCNLFIIVNVSINQGLGQSLFPQHCRISRSSYSITVEALIIFLVSKKNVTVSCTFERPTRYWYT